MSFDPLLITRDNIRKLTPYSSARNEFSGQAQVYLDANESPFNSPYNRYPDPLQTDLKKRIGQLFHVKTDSIFLGNGSDEAIDLLFRVFCQPGSDNVISIDPSYGMYKVCADINNTENRKVLLNEDFSLNAPAILNAADANSKLIFLCSPNNPSGNLLSKPDIIHILENFHGIVVVDEAYIDFSLSNGLISHIDSYPNLVVLRTFSKAWGLAAIRLGMAFANPIIINLFNKVKYPYNINLLTQKFALEVLHNTDHKNKWIKTIIKERENLADQLQKLPLVEKVFPSDANFLLTRFRDPLKLFNYLKENGIIVRDRSNVVLCENSLRITVGNKTENELLLKEIYNFARYNN